MPYLLALALLLALPAVWAVSRAAAWFADLNADALAAPAERLLESPTSLQREPAPSLFAPATKSLTVVVPAYNEAARLPATLDEALHYLQARRDREGAGFTYEVLVVDDGSTDATVATALGYSRRFGTDVVRVMRLGRNQGKGHAVRAGALAARGALVLMADADGATQASDAAKLEAALRGLTSAGRIEEDTCGVAVGSRAHLEAAALARRTWARNLLMRGFHLLVVLVAGHAVRDTQCGFKLFTRRTARLLFPNQRLRRWCFDVELLLLAARLRQPVAEVAVNWTEIAGSKVRATSVAHMAWELAALWLAYDALALWPIRGEGQAVSPAGVRPG